MEKPYEVILFSNRNIAVFNREGKQLPEWGSAVSCYPDRDDKPKALELSKLASVFWFSKWGYDRISLTAREFQYLVGLRTIEMDMEELKGKAR